MIVRDFDSVKLEQIHGNRTIGSAGRPNSSRGGSESGKGEKVPPTGAVGGLEWDQPQMSQGSSEGRREG